MKHYLILLYITACYLAAQAQSLQLGLLAKEEMNIISIQNQGDVAAKSQMQRMQLPAWGIGAWKFIGNHVGLHGSVLLSRAYYNVNYSNGAAVFSDADIRFTQSNLTLEYYFGTIANALRPFLFGGAQHLYRRYGTESFRNAVIANSYWPTSRLQGQWGVGLKISDNDLLGIRIFGGLRYNFDKQLVYDKKMNQIFAGISVSWAIKDGAKKPGSRCPDFF